MKLRCSGRTTRIPMFKLLAVVGCLGFGTVGLVEAGGVLTFSSEAFLDYEENGGTENSTTTSSPTTASPTGSPTTSAPSVSNAPTMTKAPTGTPTQSLAPSDNPTESPAPSPSPSEAPTNAPTGTPAPTAAPSDNPTESPAPSPSPSEAPTMAPTVSAAPSGTPSVSSAPSDLPSEAPSNAPSAIPSDSPSAAPTISMMPSDLPSDSPSDAPSVFPSDSPSEAPSATPSDSPSSSPTISPSAAPSVSMAPSTSEPSAQPSSAPTEVSFKTKTGTTSVFLEDIVDMEMAGSALAEFEVTTLQFIRDTQTATPGYTLDLLAVTVLTQTVASSSAEPESGEEVATMESSAPTTVGLQVSFRTVGVVTEGVAPRDFVLTNVTDAGFEYYFGEYLYRLSRADPFFEPLADHVDTTSMIPVPDRVQPSMEDDEPRKQGQFVAAIFFATVAMLIAISATVYAVRKHFRKQEKQRMRALQYPGHTRTMSDEEDPQRSPRGENFLHDDDMSDLSATHAEPQGHYHHDTQKQMVGTSSNPLQLNIDDEKIEMEDVGLTPMSLPPGARGGFSSVKKQRPMSPNAMERGSVTNGEGAGSFMDLQKKRSSFGRAFGMKKWLTPRKNSGKSSGGAIDLNDPPEHEEDGIMNTTTTTNTMNKRSKSNRQSMEPVALKAATRNAAGVWSDEPTVEERLEESSQGQDYYNKNGSNSNSGTTPLGIPARFFGRQSSDARSDATSNNIMDSMIEGSTGSSFFANMAGNKGSVFTGRKSGGGGGGGGGGAASEVGNKDRSSSYKFGATTNNNAGGGSRDPFSISEENLAILRTNSSNENVEASIAGLSEFEKKRSVFELRSSTATNRNINNEGRDDDFSPVHEQQQQRQQQQPQRDADIRIGGGSRTFEADSVYSEQSELDLNELGIETTLGALPPRYDNNEPSDTPVSHTSAGSFVGHQYGSRPMASNNNKVHLSTTGGGKHPSAGGNSSSSMHYVGTISSNKSILAAEEERRRMSLNAAIQQGDTYDVFAPPGPIGIVVDTSKMGPAVHSLKSTSPMLGLINPGDLIIALDDEDTRNLTAASLTRLMAKKSRQKERKITLLAPDGF